MKPDGCGYFYANQAEAEKGANRWRDAYVALLDDLRELNERVDSKSLNELINERTEGLS